MDRFDNDLVDTRVLEADDFRVEENFWRTEPLGANLGVVNSCLSAVLVTNLP